MSLQVASDFVPAGGQAFYLLEDTYLKGSLQIRDTVADRDSIAIANLKVGALVLTLEDKKIWIVSELTFPTRENPDAEEKVTWEEFLTGGIPDDAPSDDKIYGRQNGAWVEVQASGTTGKRLVAIQTFDNLASGAFEEFSLVLAPTAIVISLSVSRPVKITAYGTPEKLETNPYQFLATADHLIDDGSMLLSDGSVFRTRNFSIFANMEAEASDQMYFIMESVDDAEGPVTMTLTYLPMESLA